MVSFHEQLSRQIRLMRRRLAEWLDESLRRVVRNAGTLVMGNAMQSALGVVSLAVTARALGPADFGRLVLATAYASVVTMLLGFQSWQAVIRYGTQALTRDNVREFMGVVRAGAVLDAAAAVAACAVALSVVTFGACLIGLDDQSRAVAQLASVAIIANIVGTPTALLRVFDRYKLFVVQTFLTSLTKLILVGVAFVLDGGLWAFALAWIASQVFGYVLLVGLGVRELVHRGMLNAPSLGLRETFRVHPDLAHFFLITNLYSTVRALRDLDIPLLGWALGPSATASFKIARQVAAALNKVIDPFFVAVYPDLARLHSQGKTADAKRLVYRSAVSLGAVGVVVFAVFLVIGEPLMVWVLGEEFRAAYVVTAWCIVGAVVWAFAQPLSPMLMVLGRHAPLLVINVTASVLYLIGVGTSAKFIGLSGVGAAYAGFLLLWALLSALLLKRSFSADGGIPHGTNPSTP